MPACSHCGGPVSGGNGGCARCGDASPTAELKIDPKRVDQEGRRNRAPVRGAWRRGSADDTAGVAPLSRLGSEARRRVAPSEGALALAPVEIDPIPEAAQEVVTPELAQEDRRQVSGEANEGAAAAQQPAEVLPLRPAAEEPAAAARPQGLAAPKPTPTTGQFRPPVLASEALARELAPAEPGKTSGRVAAVGLGLGGAASSFLLSGTSGSGLAISGALFALFLLGLTPMPYPARAAATVTLAGYGLAMASVQQLQLGAGLPQVALSISVTMLALALLFRGWHRASLLSRALVALGITLCAGWMWLSGAVDSLTILQTDWQAWLPPVLQIPFALLLLLSLLAFMDARSTGACATWAVLLLMWHAAHAWSTLAIAYWPTDAAKAPAGALAVGPLTAPLFSALLAIGLSQLLAVANSFERG